MERDQKQPAERRVQPILTEQQIEEIAERAAEKAVVKLQNQIYQSVGKGMIGLVVAKLHWIIGALAAGYFAVGVHNGWIKI